MESPESAARSHDLSKRRKIDYSGPPKEHDSLDDEWAAPLDRKHRFAKTRKRGKFDRDSSAERRQVDGGLSREHHVTFPERPEREEVDSVEDGKGRGKRKGDRFDDSADLEASGNRRNDLGKMGTRKKQTRTAAGEEDFSDREERAREVEARKGEWVGREEWIDGRDTRVKGGRVDTDAEKVGGESNREKGSGSLLDETRKDQGSGRKGSSNGQKPARKSSLHREEETGDRAERGQNGEVFEDTVGNKTRRDDGKPDKLDRAAQISAAEPDRGRSRGRGASGSDFGPDKITDRGTRWQQSENVSLADWKNNGRDNSRLGRGDKRDQEEGGGMRLEEVEEMRTVRDGREEVWVDGPDVSFRAGNSYRLRRHSRWDESEVPKRAWHGRHDEGAGPMEPKGQRLKGRDGLEFGKDFSEDGNSAVKNDREEDRNKSFRDVAGNVREDFENWERPTERRRDYREEDDKSDRHRGSRDRVESSWDLVEDRGRSIAKLQDNEELGNRGRLKDGPDLGWEELEGRRRSGGGGRFGKAGRGLKRSWSPEGRRRGRGDYDEYDREWSDDRKDFERERGYRRDYDRERDSYRERERDFQRERDRERDNYRDRDSEFVRDRERARDREDSDRWKNRQRDRQKEKDDKNEEEDYFHFERDSWEMHKRGMEKLERERIQRSAEDRDRMERERVDTLKSPQNSGITMDSMERIMGNFYNTIDSIRDRGFGSGPAFPMRRGEFGGPMGDFHAANIDADWIVAPSDDRIRPADGFAMGGSEFLERFPVEEEGPPGLDQSFGPSSSRVVGDGGINFNIHGGRGRGPKGSPGHRVRGGQVGGDGRPPFAGNQGPGMMMRGMQQGGRGGRGRGGGKGGRGGARDSQRGIPPPMMGPGSGPGPGPGTGPGMGPHFGPLGPPGPMRGPGPNLGLGPAPVLGPGAFPLPPFAGPMGWPGGCGSGEMGMLPGPPGPAPVPVPAPVPAPRFVPTMGPGPGPNFLFSQAGPGRGGSNGVPGPAFGGPSFGVCGVVADKGSMPRVTPRITAPAGRAPSRGEQNDYSQHFVDTGLRPQNFIRDVDLADRFEEYPKLKELIARKDKLIAEHACPPMYLQLDLRSTELTAELFGTRFDVILVDPPWEEYLRRAPGVGDSMEHWSFEDIQNLRIEAIADTPSFIFLWVGDAEGLDQGRLCLKKWGFRRCEDICWVKTNRENPTPALRHDSSTLLQHSKEHCLMGIKGTVRRSTDGHVIHANIDTDIIISEEPPYGSTAKPEELYHIIEHFAQGQRRLELFGEDHNIRAGWFTVGKGLTSSNFNCQTYVKYFADADGKVWQGGRGNPPVDASHLVGTTPEIEALRPKSPPPRAQQQQQSQAANSASQPSPPNPSTKKNLTTSPQNVQDAVANSSTAGSVQTTANSSIVIAASPPVQGMGRGSLGQMPKLRRSPLGPEGKSPGGADGRIDEERSVVADLQERLPDNDVSRFVEAPKEMAA